MILVVTEYCLVVIQICHVNIDINTEQEAAQLGIDTEDIHEVIPLK